MKSIAILFLGILNAAALRAEPSVAISADRIKNDVRILASDEFLGRGPGEPGEAKATAYIAEAFRAAGLQPAGENETWFQDVPLVRLDRQPGANLLLSLDGKVEPLQAGRNATLTLFNPGHTALQDAPLVFAGWGIVDPAKGWDAYAGVDMAGKIAVVLTNDPDFEAGKDLGFEGKRMVYAGRVGAKFAAAAKAGASGVFVIHEDAGASYPFSQLASGDALPTMVIQPLQSGNLKFTSWITLDVANRLLKSAKLELADLKTRARDPKFRAFPIAGASFSMQGDLAATAFVSHNVLAKIAGAIRPQEFVLYGAHFDANGQNGPDASGDAIRNGAVDNATGTAEVLEIARAFKAAPPPARTVVFALWTAEEKGLLGSEFYAAHPLYPLARTAAAINLDPHVVLPAARDIELIGGGRTRLEADLARVAKSQHLRVTEEPSPEAGWYFRSDHFSFARRGVPALAFRAGRDLVDGGTAAGQRIVSSYNAACYHQPCDQFDPGWTFAGTVQEATVAYLLGKGVANSTGWPTWNAGNEYEELRRKMKH
ncbi:MAG TPA: M28 family peptidase [Rudaea sp.]|nr:M28 family peptidase [Rudaea sp.]